MTRHSLGGLFVLSVVASSFVFTAACEDGENLDATKVSPVPEAGPPLADSGTDTGKEVCPAADYLAGKPLPTTGGTMHGGEKQASQTWKAVDSPHIVTPGTAVEFNAGTTLTIEPCAVVLMGDGDSISFGGLPNAEDVANLVAAGDATHPIVITSRNTAKNAWGGLFLAQTGPTTRLSYVTIEHSHDAHNDVSVLVSGKSSPRIDHTTVRDGKGDGIHISGNATSWGAGSEANIVTRMGGYPIATHIKGMTSLPEGTYTGNGTDRLKIVHEGGPVVGDVTWHKRSLPYFFEGNFVSYHGKLTIEPGVHVFIGERPSTTNPGEATFEFVNGGSLVANGGAEATRIVIEGDKGKPWAGFMFSEASPIVGLMKSGPGVFNFVTIKNAGGGNTVAGGNVCTDTTGTNVALFVAHDVVDVKNTEFFDVGANNYAIGRDFCGPGGAYQTEASRKNVFHGTMHCPVTDQTDCTNGGGCNGAIPDPTCCLHAYACNGTMVP